MNVATLAEVQEEVATVLCEFLEAAVHQVLHLREVYNPELFDRHRYLNITVRKSRHPDLNEYIHSLVESLKVPLREAKLQKVAILLLDSHGRTVERYVVQLQVDRKGLCHLNAADLDAALRGFLLKLQYVDACLKPLPKGCTFDIVAYCYERDMVPLQMWVEGNPGTGEMDVPRPVVMPIKSASLAAGALQLQLYAES
ncbi:hypothetical protein WJX72_011659 [[Myrmecia] bisecta]|uniref:HORMA domain-containing protein n=1 Tax=[Myrmecia] bisecta TaxID=41462 RepID=A0AAW1QB98_9CHLO